MYFGNAISNASAIMPVIRNFFITLCTGIGALGGVPGKLCALDLHH